MGRVIFITSFKGGVGKTTISANLSSVLAEMGYKTLAVDGDFGMRCLDMALGLESEAVYNIGDVLNGVCHTEDAIISSDSVENLDFLAAPVKRPSAELPANVFIDLFKHLRALYDYVIVDSSAEDSPYYRAFASAADDALVVSLHQSLSIRAAERTGICLSEMGFRNLRLIVNCYRSAYEGTDGLPTLYELIHLSAIRLLGVVPYDESAFLDQENGTTAFGTANRRVSPYEAAIYNIASRITGKNVPLLKNVGKSKKKSFYF